MREIKNNVEVGKIPKADFKKEKCEEAEPQFCGESNNESPKVKDFSNPTEALGRSQVNKADNLKTDIAFCSVHPEAVENSDKLFEIAFKGLQDSGDPNAYEKACAIATCEDAKELFSK